MVATAVASAAVARVDAIALYVGYAVAAGDFEWWLNVVVTVSGQHSDLIGIVVEAVRPPL